MDAARKEQLEVAGYASGRATRRSDRTAYRPKRWTDEEAAAYQRSFEEGMAYSIYLKECEIVDGGMTHEVAERILFPRLVGES